MQRIGLLLVVLIALGANRGASQQAAGSALWRVAATTLAVPPALAVGPSGTFWNPAQTQDSARVQASFEAIQTPAAIGASGVLAALRIPARALGGQIGLVYGRVGLSDLTRTSDSPDPDGSTIPVYTFALGANWSGMVRETNIGATLALQETQLDTRRTERWTVDVGASRSFVSERIRVAAATHFFSAFRANDPAHDIYAGVEGRLWQGPLWGERGAIWARYGLTFAHGFGADHHIGVGAQFAKAVTLDLAVVREGSYSEGGWRPVAGLGIAIGKYRVTLARDAGLNELGSAYRVGVDARFK